MKLDGYTRLAAVVANPIKHSISPFIHNSALRRQLPMVLYVAWEIETRTWQKQSPIFAVTRCLGSISHAIRGVSDFYIWMS